MSIERETVLFYGVKLSNDDARERLRRIGGHDTGDEPVWDLAIALDLDHAIIGDAYGGGKAWLIGCAPIFDRVHAVVNVDIDKLGKLRQEFADKSPNWHIGEWVH